MQQSLWGISKFSLNLYSVNENTIIMTEEAEFVLDAAREQMEHAMIHLEKEFSKIRAGKASPSMLGGVIAAVLLDLPLYQALAMASGFGWRSDPFTKARKMHYGMDFTSPRGTPIYASGDGKIIRADNNSSGFGKHIRIDHGYGYLSLYAHLSKYNVKKGQKVKRGDLIGFVGSTGRSEAPHLHYEVWKDKDKINPINFYYGSLSPKEFENMLKYANQENQSLD